MSAKDDRYNRSEKGRARWRRYRQNNAEAVRERDREYWHRASGGYIRRRKRALQAQRAAVLYRLDELKREATSFDF